MRGHPIGTGIAPSRVLRRFLLGDQAAGNFMARLADVPELRRARIEELRQQIQAGTYIISPKRIADAMLSSPVIGQQ